MPNFYKRLILLAAIAATGGVVLANVMSTSRASNVPAPPAVASSSVPEAQAATGEMPAAVNEKLADLQGRLATNPRDADALSQLGDMYMGARRYPQAADLYAQAVDVEPRNAEYHTGYGIALFYAGMQQMGARELRQAVELNPDNAEAQFNFALAVSHGPTANLDAADTAWQAVVRLDPDGPLGAQARTMLAAPAAQAAAVGGDGR